MRGACARGADQLAGPRRHLQACASKSEHHAPRPSCNRLYPQNANTDKPGTKSPNPAKSRAWGARRLAARHLWVGSTLPECTARQAWHARSSGLHTLLFRPARFARPLFRPAHFACTSCFGARTQWPAGPRLRPGMCAPEPKTQCAHKLLPRAHIGQGGPRCWCCGLGVVDPERPCRHTTAAAVAAAAPDPAAEAAACCDTASKGRRGRLCMHTGARAAAVAAVAADPATEAASCCDTTTKGRRGRLCMYAGARVAAVAAVAPDPGTEAAACCDTASKGRRGRLCMHTGARAAAVAAAAPDPATEAASCCDTATKGRRGRLCMHTGARAAAGQRQRLTQQRKQHHVATQRPKAGGEGSVCTHEQRQRQWQR